MSYVNVATCEAGGAAEVAASCKEAKNADSLDERYVSEPIAVETFGVFSSSALILLHDLVRRISGKVYNR